MNNIYIHQNGTKISYKGGDKIYVNDKSYDVPEHIQAREDSLKIIDDKIYLNGYEFDYKNDKWIMTKSQLLFNVFMIILSFAMLFILLKGLFL